MKIIGMIPARAGSKRVKNKNLRILDGKPLIEHIIEAARSANSETQRWTAVEVRLSKCREKLSARNYGILRQISYFLFSFRLPFVLMADFNFAPDVLEHSGWCSCIMRPYVPPLF